MNRAERIVDAVERRGGLISAISGFLDRNPEMGFQEFEAVRYLTGMLAEHGFRVDCPVAGLPTAFVARKGSGRPRIGLLAEYDAVSPSLGHACGHSLISAASVAAAIVLAEHAGPGEGTVEVLGTPAEEEGGGKVIMARAGVFDGLDAVFYMHPSYNTRIGGRTLSTRIVEVHVRGRAAHPVRAPMDGRHAAQALIHVHQIVESLRQRFPEGVRLNGVVSEGGRYTSSIPDAACGRFQIFALEPEHVETVTAMIRRVAEGVAIATDTACEVREGPLYLPRSPNKPLAELIERHMRRIGLTVADMPAQEQGYTDVGNVCRAAPTVQGYITLGAGKLINHTREFAEACRGPGGHAAAVNAAKVMALAGLELMRDPRLVERIQEDFAAERR